MRALLAFLLLAAATAAGAFFAGRPGKVEIVWQGWQVDTSVAVLVAAVALVALIAAMLVLAAGALRRLPRNFRRRRAARRRRSGDAALTRGLVALAAGEAAEARRYAERAAALLGGAPLALLLAAEAATRQGDAAAARQAYAGLLERPETEFLGLRGLIGQALRGGDDGAARQLAERARLLRPESRWLADSLMVLQARNGNWQAAWDTLVSAMRRRALPPERARHHRGVLLYELSRAAEAGGEVRQATALAARAQAGAPDLAPLACHHVRLLIGQGRRRAAAKAIERAWRSAAHPDLARLYLDLHPDAGPLARAAALQRLAGRNPESAESRLAIAEAALAARLWGEARRQLNLVAASAPSAQAGPGRRLCLLMARLEENEAGDLPAGRAWLDRAIGAPPDPCYVCNRCGAETPEWHSLCRECGGFDTLFWHAPTEEPHPAGGPAAAVGALLLPPSPDGPGASLPVPSRLAAAVRWDN